MYLYFTYNKPLETSDFEDWDLEYCLDGDWFFSFDKTDIVVDDLIHEIECDCPIAHHTQCQGYIELNSESEPIFNVETLPEQINDTEIGDLELYFNGFITFSNDYDIKSPRQQYFSIGFHDTPWVESDDIEELEETYATLNEKIELNKSIDLNWCMEFLYFE